MDATDKQLAPHLLSKAVKASQIVSRHVVIGMLCSDFVESEVLALAIICQVMQSLDNAELQILRVASTKEMVMKGLEAQPSIACSCEG
jgi:hypothetical protein